MYDMDIYISDKHVHVEYRISFLLVYLCLDVEPSKTSISQNNLTSTGIIMKYKLPLYCIISTVILP